MGHLWFAMATRSSHVESKLYVSFEQTHMHTGIIIKHYCICMYSASKHTPTINQELVVATPTSLEQPIGIIIISQVNSVTATTVSADVDIP